MAFNASPVFFALMNGYTLTTAIGMLRIMTILEGLSYLLLGLTMPLKYLYELPTPNYYVGMFHGIFFIIYCFLVIKNGFKLNLSIKLVLLSLIASLIPLGTFYADQKWFKEKQLNY